MKKNSKVSILIVTYNQEDFIYETIMSAVNQSYENTEIVVTDDCSTDGAPIIIKKLAQKYKNIKFIQPSVNLGVTGNSNFGLSQCDGDFVSFLGGDDLYLKDKVKEQVAFMESNPKCDVSYHNLDVFDSKTNKTIRLFNDPRKRIEGDVKTVIKLGTFNGASSCMVRKSCIPNHLFDVSVPFASDWLFWVECLSKGGEIRYINKVLGRYRRHLNNVTTLNKPQCTKDLFFSCAIILERYPQFTYEALCRQKSLILELRKAPDFDYSSLLKIGISNFSIKCLIIWVIYKTTGLKK